MLTKLEEQRVTTLQAFENVFSNLVSRYVYCMTEKNIERATFVQVAEMVLTGQEKLFSKYLSIKEFRIPRVQDFDQVLIRGPFMELSFKMLEKEAMRFADQCVLQIVLPGLDISQEMIEKFATSRFTDWEMMPLPQRERLLSELSHILVTPSKKLYDQKFYDEALLSRPKTDRLKSFGFLTGLPTVLAALAGMERREERVIS